MRYVKIILTSIFLLIWQMYIPVHSACADNEHIKNVNMSCCSGEEKCNCCCSHDIESGNKSQCSQCANIDIDADSKVFELNKKITDYYISKAISTVINLDTKSSRFEIFIPEIIHIKEKPYILISSLLI